ncbi:hypothetical protein C8Q78DRAFT_993016 [Trametes maxima]|nr:hypothetical protein C8Q78DRAFT_993016 [Trametes maxima]
MVPPKKTSRAKRPASKMDTGKNLEEDCEPDSDNDHDHAEDQMNEVHSEPVEVEWEELPESSQVLAAHTSGDEAGDDIAELSIQGMSLEPAGLEEGFCIPRTRARFKVTVEDEVDDDDADEEDGENTVAEDEWAWQDGEVEDDDDSEDLDDIYNPDPSARDRLYAEFMREVSALGE